jgi:hypothetical protein
MDSISHLSGNLPSVWSFLSHIDFWIFFGLAALSIYYSYRSFKEASAAKEAAQNAATTVKVQTITIELSEIIQKIGRVDPKIDFIKARDLLSDTTWRIKRLVVSFRKDEEYKDAINKLNVSLENASKALQKVKPLKDEPTVNSSVYNAIESHFSAISSLLAELMGLFEKRTINT